MNRRMISVLITTVLLFNVLLTIPMASLKGSEAKAVVGTETKNKAKKIFLGGYHSAAVMENGDLYCWGSNYYGQVGNGTTKKQNTPIKVLGDVKTVFLEEYGSAAITENGDLYCWGYNSNGQIGNGTTKNQDTPVKVLGDVKIVSLGKYYSAAITENGDLYCWGSNVYGKVGNGTTEDQETPVKVLGNIKMFVWEGITVQQLRKMVIYTVGDIIVMVR